MSALPLHRRPLPASLGAVAVAAAALLAPFGSAADGPALIEELRANGAETTSLGMRSGLDGWLVERPGEDAYTVYLTRDDHAVLGLLYGPDGALLSAAQIEAARNAAPADPTPTGPAGDAGRGAKVAWPPVPSPLPPLPDTGGDLLARSAAAFGFTLGAGGPPVAIFADPECPFSRSAVARLGERAMAGGFRLRVVPVALLGAAAARRAAGIAASPEPALAWFDDAAAARATGAAAARIAANNALFDAAGGTGTPLLLWRGGGAVERQAGDVADVDAWLAGIGP